MLDSVTLGTDLGPGEMPEYGEVLKTIFDADPILSVRGDMAVDCWRIIDSVLEAWRRDQVPLQEYAAGSAGPDDWPLSGESPGASESSAQPVVA